MDNEIETYIQYNRPFYDRQTITEKLLQRGFSQTEIDNTWQLVEFPPKPKRFWQDYKYWAVLIGFYACVAALDLFFYIPFRDLNISFIILIICCVGAGIGAFALRKSDPSKSKALFHAVLIPIMVFIGVYLVFITFVLLTCSNSPNNYTCP